MQINKKIQHKRDMVPETLLRFDPDSRSDSERLLCRNPEATKSGGGIEAIVVWIFVVGFFVVIGIRGFFAGRRFRRIDGHTLKGNIGFRTPLDRSEVQSLGEKKFFFNRIFHQNRFFCGSEMVGTKKELTGQQHAVWGPSLWHGASGFGWFLHGFTQSVTAWFRPRTPQFRHRW